MGKVEVLTSQQRWKNEEVTIKVVEKLYTVEVVEITYDWSPFNPASFYKAEEDSDEEDDESTDKENDEEDGVSDIWMGKDNLDMEEGEITPEEQYSLQLVEESVMSASKHGDATRNQEQDWPKLTPSVILELNPTIDETFMTFNAKKKISKNLETIDIHRTNMDDGVTHKNMIQLAIRDNNNNDNETMEKVS